MRKDSPGRQAAHAQPALIIPELRTYQVGALVVSLGNNTAFLPEQRGNVASMALEDWVLVYRRGGASDGQSPVRLQSASCPSVQWNLAGETMLVHFPRTTFKGLENYIEAICACRAEFAASPLLVAYLESLWGYLPALRENEQHVVEAVTKQLVRSCIARTGELEGAVSRPASRGRLESAKRYIDERIGSGNLTVDHVQGWLGVSRRQLYSLFESYGGVARYIQSQRLRKCHSAMADPLEKRPIARIAEQYGIDPARVERLFREEFGYDPEDARPAAACSGDAIGAPAIAEVRVA